MSSLSHNDLKMQGSDKNKNSKVKSALTETLLGGFVFGTLAIAMILTVTHGSPKIENLGIVLMDILAGGIITYLFRLYTTTYERLIVINDRLNISHDDLKEQVDLLANEINNLQELRFSDEVWSKTHNFMKGYKSHSLFVNSILKQFSYTDSAMLANVNAADFYEVLVKALQGTRRWNTVHQGSIKLLCRGYPLDDTYSGLARDNYLSRLQNKTATHVVKKRVIILLTDHAEEIEDQNIMKKFWDSTGKTVPSFCIYEPDLVNFLGGDNLPVLHDCALHDGELLLHYNRVTKTVFLGDRFSNKAKLIEQIFSAIEANNIIFKQVTGPEPLKSWWSARTGVVPDGDAPLPPGEHDAVSQLGVTTSRGVIVGGTD